MAKMVRINTDRNGSIYDTNNPIELPDDFGLIDDSQLLRENEELRVQIQGLLENQQTGIVPDDAGAFLVRNGAIEHTRAKFTPVAMMLPADLTEGEWMAIGYTLLSIKSALQWYLGDWLLMGKQQGTRWSGAYQELSNYFSYEIHTLETYESVCKKIHSSIRIENLSFSHHRLVTGERDPEKQRAYLEFARDNNLSMRDFRNYLRKLKSRKSKKSDIVTLKKVTTAGQTYHDHLEQLFTSGNANPQALMKEIFEQMSKLKSLYERIAGE